MSSIYMISGPCGCGKSTVSDAFARRLIDHDGRLQVYVIHGDDFHAGFVETERRVGENCPGFLYWADILRFNWSCILSVAEKALNSGLDVVIDYVVEDELPLVAALAKTQGAKLHYAVLTAAEDDLRRRLEKRGNPELTERSLFLKKKLEAMLENQGCIINTSDKTVAQVAEEVHRRTMQ